MSEMFVRIFQAQSGTQPLGEVTALQADNNVRFS